MIDQIGQEYLNELLAKLHGVQSHKKKVLDKILDQILDDAEALPDAEAWLELCGKLRVRPEMN